MKERTIKPSIIKKPIPKNTIRSGNKSPERKFKTLQNSKGKAYKEYQNYSEAKNLKNKERFLNEKSGQNVKELGNIFEGGEAVRGQAKIEDSEWEKSEVGKKRLIRVETKGQITEEKSADRKIPPDQTKPTG